MVMEYMENDSLFAYLKNNQSAPFDSSKKVDIALDIARGMDYLHRLRIIHRDLKMGNVLLDSSFNAKISDFGLSIVKESQNSMISLQEAGTPSYMAPETFGAGAVFSSKSDVFAFGILLWGLIHWSQPFGGVQREEIRQLVWKERYRLPISSGAPRQISSVISCCWLQSPQHRPTMSEVKEFLEKVVMVEGLINQNEVFTHEMTTQATVMDTTVKMSTPTSKLITLATKAGAITKSDSSLSDKEDMLNQKARAQFSSMSSIGSTGNLKIEAHRKPPTMPVIIESAPVSTISINKDKVALRQAPPIPLSNSSYNLKSLEKQEVGLKTPNAPSFPPNLLEPPKTFSKAPSSFIQQPMNEEVFRTRAALPKQENVPKKLWFGWRKKIVLGAILAGILIIIMLIVILVMVISNSQSKSTNLETQPTPSLCKIERTAINLGCKISNPVLSTFAGSRHGSSVGDRLSTALFAYPNGLAFHPDGSLFVSDYFGLKNISGDNVYPFTFNNSRTLFPSDPILRQFSIDSDGVIYIPTADRYIVAIDTAKSEGTLFAGNLTFAGERDSTDLLDSKFENLYQTYIYNNTVYVVNRRSNSYPGNIKILDNCLDSSNHGTRTLMTATSLNARPFSMVIDDNGDIYYSTDNNCITKYLAESKSFIPCFAGTPDSSGQSDGVPGVGQFYRPMGLAFGGCGNLFVADYSNSMIRMVDKMGVITTVATELHYPTALAFSDIGDLYVTDSYSHTIKKITFDA
jgi:serine/threonine protein kinase